MKTLNVRFDPHKVEPRRDGRERHDARSKVTWFVFVVACVLGAAALSGCTDQGDDTTPSTRDRQVTDTIPPLSAGIGQPGRYAFTTFGPDLDASYQISIEVPNGYDSFEGWAALRIGTGQTAVSTLAIGDVYADPCRWKGTELDRSTISTTDDVAAALAIQQGLRVSAPRDVSLDGFAGTYLERRVPARTDLSDCDGAQFRVYLDEGRGPGGGGERYLVPGELQRLWILDIEDVPLVIDASTDPGTSARVRGELLRMVESIQIDPREEV